MAEADLPSRSVVGGAGQVYASLIAARLAEEEGRHRSLQARGLAVVTTSGTLVTLIFAVAQFVPRNGAAAGIPDTSRWLLAIAALVFVIAAVGGLIANLPRDLGRPVSSDIAKKIDSEWGKSSASAEKTVALTRAGQLQKLEGVNDAAAWAVLTGLAVEFIAITLAAVAIVVAV